MKRVLLLLVLNSSLYSVESDATIYFAGIIRSYFNIPAGKELNSGELHLLDHRVASYAAACILNGAQVEDELIKEADRHYFIRTARVLTAGKNIKANNIPKLIIKYVHDYEKFCELSNK